LIALVGAGFLFFVGFCLLLLGLPVAAEGTRTHFLLAADFVADAIVSVCVHMLLLNVKYLILSQRKETQSSTTRLLKANWDQIDALFKDALYKILDLPPHMQPKLQCIGNLGGKDSNSMSLKSR
jgi:hypothetical protein